MRIAVVSDDGQTISAHFGRAKHYVVLEVREGEIKTEERRDKPGHHTFQDQHQHDPEGDAHPAGERHGMGEGAQLRHKLMIDVIQDCGVIITRGMGRGAYLNMQQAGIKPFVTDIEDIHQAVQAYIDGTLIDHNDRLH